MLSICRATLLAMIPVVSVLLPEAKSATGHPPLSATVAAPDTTFKPEGSYTIDVAVGGQVMVMIFVVEKKADGSYGGLFKHAEMGEFAATSFKVEGRTMSMGIMTPGGAATVTLTVTKENVVEGEWSMQGDGSKILGKKTSSP
jgi:hypothetical protein